MLCFKHDARHGPAINLSNVQPNEHFNYSIILIRGEILHFNHRIGITTLQITNPNNNENTCIEQVEIRSDGKFSVAIELVPGINLLKFQYCCVTNEIPLVFKATESPKYLLKVLYIICRNHDGCFQAPNAVENSIETACGKIDLAIRMVQCLFAEMIKKHGFDRKTFAFVKCQPFYSSLSIQEARQWNQNELWTYHAKEILAHELKNGQQQQQFYKYFGILASTLCENAQVTGNAALGIGDVALFGSGTLYTWPLYFASIQMCFRNETAVDTNQLMDDSNGRRTYGGCFATALGSMCHEIGHIFDLGHTKNGIMGCDIDYVQRVFIIEKCPRDLPRRVTTKCSMQPESCNRSTSQRLTSVKKNNSILNNYHSRKNDDLTFLTENCAILLNYHKWFNQPEVVVESDMRYDFDRKMIVTSLPLALVEFRSAIDGMCMKYYRFDDVSNEYQFTIPTDVDRNECDLIALDKNGNVLRLNMKEIG